ncbi:MAG: 50S ribosomal protein L19 [Candidatus Wildermuthbacteria bacterium]|nr:50S ribosomal protein L19 [Candidatus Wildermuthbacteria bacterium]
MSSSIETFVQPYIKKEIPDFRAGDTVRVYQKVKEGDKERIQPFEGIVIARKHGAGISATFIVRKISHGVGVERIFPLHSPSISKIEVVKKGRVRRAKLYYLRQATAKRVRAKVKEATAGTEKEAEVTETAEEITEPTETKK